MSDTTKSSNITLSHNRVSVINKCINLKWLNWIREGKMKYISYPSVGTNIHVKVGDIIVFGSSEDLIKTRVTDITIYSSFTDAFKFLGQDFMPIPDITDAGIIKIYREIYHSNWYKYDVLVFKLEVIKDKIV